LYKAGDAGVRDALLNAVLEHLFENRELADFFKDWLDDPALAEVYRDALLWTTEMPTRQITRSSTPKNRHKS
jgi:hypothetical protein